MYSFYSLLLSFLVLFSSVNASFAQTEKKEEAPKPDAMSAPADKAEGCPCLKPAVEQIQKVYNSLEEDEWTQAESSAKNAQSSIKTLSATCKCPEVSAYQKVADAYLKYAQGGNHLDGADEPNCPFALKLYADAISALKEAIPSITNVDVKNNASNILDYAEEEQQFVKDECDEKSQPPAKKS